MWYRVVFAALVLVVPLFLAGCPPPPPSAQPALLGTATLGNAPVSLAVDPVRGRAYVTDGPRVRAVDLASRSLIDMTSPGGQFIGIDPVDDVFGILSPENGWAQSIMTYQAGFPNAGIPSGIAYDPATHSVFVIDNASSGSYTTLFRVDLETFERTSIGESGLGAELRVAYGIARDPATGLLYTVDATDFLWRIDPDTANAAKVGPYIGMSDIQGLAFSPGGRLYGINRGNPCSVARISLDTGTATEAVSLPLGYVAVSLAFKPNGTCWAVDTLRDALIQIDLGTGAIVTEFDPFPVRGPYSVGLYLEDVFSLTFLPDGVEGGFLMARSDPEAVAVLPGGDVLASSSSDMTRMDTNLAQVAGLAVDGIEQFTPIVVNPATGLAYTKGGLSGLVFEIDPGSMTVLREIELRAPRSTYTSTFTPHMDIDPQTNRLFVRDPEALYIVNLSESAKALVETASLGFVPEGVLVDADRRLLVLNQLQGSSPGASVQVRDIDTFDLIATRSLGNQIHWMAIDADRGRLAANVRVTTSFTTEVKLLSLPDLTPVNYGLRVEGEREYGSLDALIAFDVGGGQLLVARDGNPPRVDFYESP